MRLLVVEDEEDLADALRFGLASSGFAVDVALTGADAEERLSVNAYDVVVLDLNLPDADGVDILRSLRSGELDAAGGADTRVLLLTARSSLDHRVRGLDAGADDYLVKPFAFQELQARLRALLRRETAGGDAVLRVGPVELDTARRTAARSGRELRLTNKELGVLEYLMHRPGHVVSSEELLEHVWDENADPFTQTVRVTVGTLRRKLSLDDEEQLLETVVGQGYRLREPAGGPR
ncbi:DNA-binding response OmpR family regulator [Motilibacter peucedani]|uniref:DNA-binding response OmpR family regulator n=1 Tax=Motilibacter peucedani TaxID=598650 RepID=A0A420XP47_9ACTN|nr:response regulator transcription factor [Motilibacter peucedani]RKS73942.1 DNA-binding response OmpR family regulator [Motilibacter peucedani]